MSHSKTVQHKQTSNKRQKARGGRGAALARLPVAHRRRPAPRRDLGEGDAPKAGEERPRARRGRAQEGVGLAAPGRVPTI